MWSHERPGTTVSPTVASNNNKVAQMTTYTISENQKSEFKAASDCVIFLLFVDNRELHEAVLTDCVAGEKGRCETGWRL